MSRRLLLLVLLILIGGALYVLSTYAVEKPLTRIEQPVPANALAQ